MAFADDYALIGSFYGGMNSALYNVERRHSGSAKEGLDYNTIDDATETDVEFMNQLYRNSHPNYFLGSWIIKPVVEILLHYMGYPRITSKDTNLADKLNEFYETKKGSLQQLLRELGLFGEEYAVLGYDSELEMPTLKPRNKNFIVETRYEDFNNPDELTYIAVKEIVSQVKPNTSGKDSEKEQVTFLKIYWKEKNHEYEKLLKANKSVGDVEPWLYYASLRRRVGDGEYKDVKLGVENAWGTIPVQQFHQNRLSNDTSGYSDVNGLVKLCGVYHQVFESMIDTNIYNGKPTLMFTGLTDSETFVRTTYGEVNPTSGEVVSAGSYEMFGSYYLEGDANAEYLTVNNSYIEGAKEILRLLFYIYVQLSGVPEWALGAHIDGTWASTKMQSTPLVQKIESKRLDINDAVIKMNVKLAKIIEANEDTEFSTYLTRLEWSEPLPEDRDYILQAIDKVIPLDILTNEKILELLDIVSDPAEEIKKRDKEKKKEVVNKNVDEKSLVDKLKEKVTLAKKSKVTDEPEEEPEEVEPDEKSTKKKKAKKKAVGEMEDTYDVLKEILGEDFLEELGLTED